MNAKIDAKKVIKKRDRNKGLMKLSYVLGFPLLILLVFIGSVSFMNGAAFTSTKIFGISAAYLGVLVCVAAWIVVVLFQIIAALITRSSTGRGVIVVIATLIVMVGGGVYFDIWAEKKVNTVRDSYVRSLYGIGDDVELSFVKNHSNKDILTFEDDEYVKKTYGKLGTLSEIEYTTDIYGIKYAEFSATVGKETKYYSKPISFEIDFNTYSYQINHYVTWTSKGSLTDDYNSMVSDFCRVYNVDFASGVKGDVNTDGSQYGATPQVDKDDNPEYWFGETGNVYKENGLYADGYIFSVDVANNILICIHETENKYKAEGKDLDKALEKALDDARKSSAWKSYVATEEYKKAYGSGGIADSYCLTKERLAKIVSELGTGLADSGLAGLVLTFVDLGGLKESDFRNLSLEKIVDVAKGFGLELNSVDDILALLGGFSNYEVSNVKPLMYFIEDETLRTYAYAKYFAEVHGANIGSVLVGDQVGKIIMGGNGYNAAENAFSLEKSYKLRAYNEYVPMLFPLFAARRYVFVFAGIITCMMALFYYAQMKVALLTKKLEKMSSLGGGR